MKSNENKKVLIFSAPSGAGKTTIVQHLLKKYSFLDFSISATSRLPRGEERNGLEYFFLTAGEFKKKIDAGDFIEYEEVYSGQFYGTLKSEIDRIWNKGDIILFDIDVKGGVNLKKIFKENAMAVFIQPPSTEVLRERLTIRGTDTPEEIEKRVSKANEELSYSKYFDKVLINDNLENCLLESDRLVEKFYEKIL